MSTKLLAEHVHLNRHIRVSVFEMNTTYTMVDTGPKSFHPANAIGIHFQFAQHSGFAKTLLWQSRRHEIESKLVLLPNEFEEVAHGLKKIQKLLVMR